jgi:RNAse (barnase) inhibitor barstar
MNAAELLKQIPPYSVQMLKGWSVDELKKAALPNRLIEVDAGHCADENALLKKLAQAFSFPAWFGHNLDALYDCLTELPGLPGLPNGTGYVVLLSNVPLWNQDIDRREALLDVFRDVADDFAERQATPFRVFYSLA